MASSSSNPQSHQSPFDYTDEFLRDVFQSVSTIAVVGASADPAKASLAVIKLLIEYGYTVFAVNPRAPATTIGGAHVYPSLADIDQPVDMVDVFRPSNELKAVVAQAVEIGARVIWGQLDIYDQDACETAKASGLSVVVDRCPLIELPRLFPRASDLRQ